LDKDKVSAPEEVGLSQQSIEAEYFHSMGSLTYLTL